MLDPFFENIRDDPEFQSIVKRAQEEKAVLRAQIREMEERGELKLKLYLNGRFWPKTAIDDALYQETYYLTILLIVSEIDYY